MIDLFNPPKVEPKNARLVTFAQTGELAEEAEFSLDKVQSYERMQQILKDRQAKSELRKKLAEWSKRKKILANALRVSKARLNRAHELMDMKKVREARESVTFNLKRLEVWDAEKPVSGD